MVDFTSIPNPETYEGKWVAFEINQQTNEIVVLAFAHCISELVTKQEVVEKNYILHKF